MKIEIVTGAHNNPVAEFFSTRSTPETDAKASVGLENADRECVPADFARKLERERDEALEQRNCLHDLHNKNAMHSKELLELCGTLRKERDEWRQCAEKLYNSSGWHDEWPMAVQHYKQIKKKYE